MANNNKAILHMEFQITILRRLLEDVIEAVNNAPEDALIAPDQELINQIEEALILLDEGTLGDDDDDATWGDNN